MQIPRPAHWRTRTFGNKVLRHERPGSGPAVCDRTFARPRTAAPRKQGRSLEAPRLYSCRHVPAWAWSRSIISRAAREFVTGSDSRALVAGPPDEPARVPGPTRRQRPIAISRAGSARAGGAATVWLGDLRRGRRPNRAPLSLAVPNLGRSVARRHGRTGGARHGTIVELSLRKVGSLTPAAPGLEEGRHAALAAPTWTLSYQLDSSRWNPASTTLSRHSPRPQRSRRRPRSAAGRQAWSALPYVQSQIGRERHDQQR